MKKAFTLSNQTIKSNIQKLKKLMTERGLEGLYISSFDPFISEYVPLQDNHRFYITGFTGSMAEVLVPLEGRVRLYVDGRYHEQADLEVDQSVVEVMKIGADGSTTEELVKDVKKLSIKRLGYEADRTTLNYLKRLTAAASEAIPVAAGELGAIIDFEPLPQLKEIQFISRELRGRDTLEKTRAIFANEKQALFLTALDSIAWITNCRGYHLPFLSSFYAKALVTKEKVYVFVTPETPVSAKAKKESGLEFITIPFTEVANHLDQLHNTLHFNEVWFDPGMINSADFGMLMKVFGMEKLVEKNGGLYDYQSIKEPVEIKQMDASFRKADQAIYNTIKWAKESVKTQKRITELDLYQETSKRYQAQGAVEQSFNTIAGVGPNGSIIHYGNPSDEVVITDTDMVLLDSGGYFEGGWATDTTRTFFAGPDAKKAHPKMIEMYTLVLKGVLALQAAVFPEGTKGMVLDGLARNAMRKKGYDYNHGTGHGVGIHVHEPGVRISSVSTVPMKLGQAVSIEPGIYVPGFGGVRIENIAYTEKHPDYPHMLRFKLFVYIGFEPALIDMKMLSDEEKTQLDEYEAECSRRGTSFRTLK
ncbi:MAG TPA: M24 family metallopeptidase [Bacteriovoracaceae bacterium]|nr:M24 family metallopeptidase [Bacteriovoracaceae bacterium]